MKNEMDLMGMDRRRWQYRSQANRITLFLVGTVWLGMIADRLIAGEIPRFLIAIVPVFALARAVSYPHLPGHP